MKLLKTVSISIFASGLLFSSMAKADSYSDENVQYGYATVLSAEPIVKLFRVSRPERECWDEQVQVKDRRGSRTNTIMGALIGGAIGNALGHHKSNKRVGAVAGALLGGSIAKDMQSKRPPRTEVYTRCNTTRVSTEEERVIGYRVTYHFQGKTYTTRMKRDPGNSVRVRLTVAPVVD